MEAQSNTYLLNTLRHLREHEEMVIYGRIHDVSATEENQIAAYLQTEYEKERLEYPHTAPPFEAPAALWAARTLVFSAQLLLYREHRHPDLPQLLPPYAGSVTAAATLSADLCLRFLPAVLLAAQAIDPEDVLATILETHLETWHYSAVGCSLSKETLDFEVVFSNRCLQQLYLNRIVALKDLKLAQLPALQTHVKANLGNFAAHFWPEL